MRGRRQQREFLQDYRNRDYCQHKLAPRVFEAFVGEDYTLSMMTTGCLDAPDEIPAGSMVATMAMFYDRSLTVRGMTAAEIAARNELVGKLMAEILAE